MRKSVGSRILAKSVAASASALKAIDIKVLDLSKLSSFTDFFVIASGTSVRHIQSIAERIVRDQKLDHRLAIGIEGMERGGWILVDYGNVVAHIFLSDTRKFYNIEKLWGDARRVNFKGIT